MLEVKSLSVTTGKKKVVDGVSLSVKDGEVHAIMGPNGAGKSTLALALMGYPEFKVTGTVSFDGKDVSKSPADERAKAGMFLGFQHPQEIEGVKVSAMVRKAKNASSTEKQTLDRMMADMKALEGSMKKAGLGKEFMQRELNVGFSGGEKKRMEIVQMMELKPKLVILDEIDSGLDVDGIKLVAEAIRKMQDGKRSFLIITHYPRLFKHLKPDFVHVMVRGRIVSTGGPELLKALDEKGYSAFTKGEGERDV
jgi:Fe-S cluster assembly ATP-binding protein